MLQAWGQRQRGQHEQGRGLRERRQRQEQRQRRPAAEGGASVDMSVGAPGLDEAGAQAVARLIASGCDVYLITQHMNTMQRSR